MTTLGLVLIALVAGAVIGAWLEGHNIRNRYRLTPRWWRLPKQERHTS